MNSNIGRRPFMAAVGGATALGAVPSNTTANHGLPDGFTVDDMVLLPGGTPTMEIRGSNPTVDHSDWQEIRAMTGAVDARLLPEDTDLYANFHMNLQMPDANEKIQCRPVVGVNRSKPLKNNTLTWTGDWQYICTGWKPVEAVPTDKLIGFIGIEARVTGGVGKVSETMMTLHLAGI